LIALRAYSEIASKGNVKLALTIQALEGKNLFLAVDPLPILVIKARL